MTLPSLNIKQELLRIADQHGGMLRAEDVVHDAERGESPLHDCFQWNNSVAAHQFRLMQARSLIRVSVEYLSSEPTLSRVFVSLSMDRYPGGGYRITTSVLDNVNNRSVMLRDALAELRRIETKYRALNELTQVWDALGSIAA
jgi:hypothetical protein